MLRLKRCRLLDQSVLGARVAQMKQTRDHWHQITMAESQYSQPGWIEEKVVMNARLATARLVISYPKRPQSRKHP